MELLLLLLSYPVARWQVIAGKFCGHFILLSLAIIIGFGSAGRDHRSKQCPGYFRIRPGPDLPCSWALPYCWVRFFSPWVWPPAHLCANAARPPVRAIGIWLLFVLIYDLGLIGLLASSTGQALNDMTITGLLLANPTDVYRMLNLTGNEETAALSAMTGLTGPGSIPLLTLTALLCLWIAAPLIAACVLFERRRL